MATLLSAAFDAGDVAAAQTALDKLTQEGLANWQLETTLSDLAKSLAQQPDSSTKTQLQDVLADLQDLLPPTP